jgi:uncharacterized protein (DUF1330 family)
METTIKLKHFSLLYLIGIGMVFQTISAQSEGTSINKNTFMETTNKQEEKMDVFYQIDITITNPEKFQEYVNHAKPLVEKFGGKMLIRGQQLTNLGGKIDGKLVGIMEFPTVDAARSWYNSKEYQAIIPIRDAGSISTFILFETVKPHTLN